jgi:nucleotide-binding universal stress UspA family protein
MRFVYLPRDAPGLRDDAARRQALGLAGALGVPLSVAAPLPEDPKLARMRVRELSGALSGRPTLVVTEAREGRRGVRPRREWSDRDLVRGLHASVWLLSRQRPAPPSPVVAAVALDDRVDSVDRGVIRIASAIARAEGRDLLTAHVWNLLGESILTCPVRGVGAEAAGRISASLHRERERRLRELVAGSGEPAEAAILMTGDRAHGLREVLAGRGASVIVIGYHGRSGLWGAIRGNLGEDFLGLPELSILALRPDGAHVASAIDDAPASSRRRDPHGVAYRVGDAVAARAVGARPGARQDATRRRGVTAHAGTSA